MKSIQGAVTLAVSLIYPLLVVTGAATFFSGVYSPILFWIGLFFGNFAIIFATLEIKVFKPISNGLIYGGLTTIFGAYGIFGISSTIFIGDFGTGNLFTSLIMTLCTIIYLANKKLRAEEIKK